MCACAGATEPADEAAGAAAEGERSDSSEEGDHHPAARGHGPQLPQTDLKGGTEAPHAGPPAQDPGHQQGRRRAFLHIAQVRCSPYPQIVCLQHVTESEQVIRELQESQASVSDRLARQRKQLTELCSSVYILDPDFVSLQDTKDRVRSSCTPPKKGIVTLMCSSRGGNLHPEPSAGV